MKVEWDYWVLRLKKNAGCTGDIHLLTLSTELIRLQGEGDLEMESGNLSPRVPA